jgi:hypothetical protein
MGACQEARAPETTATSAPPLAADAVTNRVPTDLEQLAERLVNQSAGIKEGDLVLITGGFGMTDRELAKTFREGVNVDYASLAARAEQVRGVLAGGREIEI